MVYAKNVSSLKIVIIGVDYVFFNKISKIGLAEITLLISLFKKPREVIEWIEYDRFENIEYLTKGGFATTFKAIWKDGDINYWDSENNRWIRKKTYPNFPAFSFLSLVFYLLNKELCY